MFMSTLLNMENFCARAKQNKMMITHIKRMLLNIYFKLMIRFILLMKLKNEFFNAVCGELVFQCME